MSRGIPVASRRRRPDGVSRGGKCTARVHSSCGRAFARFSRVEAARTWQMSQFIFSPVDANATRSCFATTAFAEWTLRRAQGVKILVSRASRREMCFEVFPTRSSVARAGNAVDAASRRGLPATAPRRLALMRKGANVLEATFEPGKDAPLIARAAHDRVVRDAHERRGGGGAYFTDALHRRRLCRVRRRGVRSARPREISPLHKHSLLYLSIYLSHLMGDSARLFHQPITSRRLAPSGKVALLSVASFGCKFPGCFSFSCGKTCGSA